MKLLIVLLLNSWAPNLVLKRTLMVHLSDIFSGTYSQCTMLSFCISAVIDFQLHEKQS